MTRTLTSPMFLIILVVLAVTAAGGYFVGTQQMAAEKDTAAAKDEKTTTQASETDAADAQAPAADSHDHEHGHDHAAMGEGVEQPTIANTTPEQTQAADATSRAMLEIQEDDIVLGEEDAPVTMIEYSSMSCPHCAHFATEVFPVLKEKYIDTGKVKFTNRPFPLNASALDAAKLTMCVPEEEHYSFAKALFKTQEQWAFDQNYRDNLRQIALVGGVSEEAFNACMENTELEEKLLNGRMQAHQSLGVQSTPTFFINGDIVQGTDNPDDFSAIIDTHLDAVSE